MNKNSFRRPFRTGVSVILAASLATSAFTATTLSSVFATRAYADDAQTAQSSQSSASASSSAGESSSAQNNSSADSSSQTAQTGATDTTGASSTDSKTTGFITEHLVGSKGEFTATIEINGKGDISKLGLKPEDFKFERDVTVTNIKYTSETTATLTLSVPTAATCNEASKIMDGQVVKVGDMEFIAHFNQADITTELTNTTETSDGKVKLEYTMNAQHGTFNENFDKDSVSTSHDLANGEVTNVEKTDEHTAKVTVEVPKEDVTKSDDTVSGTDGFSVAGSAMNNSWNVTKHDETKSVSTFSASPTQNTGTTKPETFADKEKRYAQFAEKFLRGISQFANNEKLKKFLQYAGPAANAINVIQTVLEFSGILGETTDPMREALKGMEERLQATLDEHTGMLRSLQESVDRTNHVSNKVKLQQLTNDVAIVQSYFTNAYNHLGVTRPSSNDSEEVLKAHSAELVSKIKQAEASGNPIFNGYTNAMNQLYNNFKLVCSTLTIGEGNPIEVFDKLCTQINNFDSQSYNQMTAWRGQYKTTLYSAISLIYLFHDYINNPNNAVVDQYKEMFVKANAVIDENPVKVPRPFASYRQTLTMYGTGWRVQSYMISTPGRNEKTLFNAYNGTKYDAWGNFTKQQMADFVKRMNGKTLEEELLTAGFDVTWLYDSTAGLGLSMESKYSRILAPFYYSSSWEYHLTYVPWGGNTTRTDLAGFQYDNLYYATREGDKMNFLSLIFEKGYVPPGSNT